MWRGVFLLLIPVILVPCGVLAGQASGETKDAPLIRATAREVQLDLIVRDRHQHVLTDLRASEVEVYEDGVRQDIRAFRNVQGVEELQAERTNLQQTAQAAGSEPAHFTHTLPQVNFVSIVFAQIAPVDRELARQAVLALLKSDSVPNTYITIYSLNHGLHLVQAYTSDKEMLAKGANAVSKGLSSNDGFDSLASVANGAASTATANIANAARSGTPGQGGPSSVDLSGAAAKDPVFVRNTAANDASVTLGAGLVAQQILYEALRFGLSTTAGWDAMDALRELVRSQEKLPGRKVVLYLSDGLALPYDRADVVDNMISLANRTGVTFYTVDTRGLSTEDPTIQSLSAMERTGAGSLGVNGAANKSGVSSSPALGHQEVDDVQLTAVSNNQLALRELAESTGGFAVANTNEIATPMQRVMEDIRTHFQIAYTPKSPIYDGHFRKIEVKVQRAKVSVQTRKGYYALPELNGEPLQRFEAIALNALSARPVPTDFAFQAELMKFRSTPGSVEYEMAVEIPLARLMAVPVPKTEVARIRASVLVIVRDANGEIVSKIGREVARDVRKGDSLQSGADRIFFAQPVSLAPGSYTVAAVVTDEQSGKASVLQQPEVVVPASSLNLSSIQVVRSMEPLAGLSNPLNPFQTADSRITPALADSVAATEGVALYFIVYPALLDRTQKLTVTLQLFRDGKLLAAQPLHVPEAESNGTIPMLAKISPGPGSCEIRITAHEGTLAAQSSRMLRFE